MKKAVLLGMAQKPTQSVFQLEKKAHSIDAVRGFLHELDFATWNSAVLLKPLGGADTGKPTIRFRSTLYDDKFFAMQRGQYNVQVFFGKKKVIVSVVTMSDEQARLRAAVLKFCEEKKPKEQMPRI